MLGDKLVVLLQLLTYVVRNHEWMKSFDTQTLRSGASLSQSVAWVCGALIAVESEIVKMFNTIQRKEPHKVYYDKDVL